MSSKLNLVVERGKTVSFETLPTKSIALDGYVAGPEIDVEGRRFSFDHHADCIRLLTSATCQQVLDALVLGLELTDMTTYINDVDGDTVLSVWLLQNPGRIHEPLVRKLVEVVGKTDAHGPAYQTADPQLATSFFVGAIKPETDSRKAGTYGQADLEKVLNECLGNVGLLLDGKLVVAAREEKPVSYTITHRGKNGFVMAESNDFIFKALYDAGIRRAIAYQRQKDGTIAYTVGKMSELIGGFPVGPLKQGNTIMAALDKREQEGFQSENHWGGSTTIGGAPRHKDGSRSRLTPDQVFATVEALL